MERQKHESLVPKWVEFWATLGSYFGYILPSRHDRLGNGMVYIGLAFVWLVFSAAAFMLQLAYWPTTPIISGYWIFVLPTVVTLSYGTMRYLSFRWIRKTWQSITGEKDLEGYLYITERTQAEARQTLQRVAFRVRNGELKTDAFHMARDIAALHWLCDEDLRIRDLIKS